MHACHKCGKDIFTASEQGLHFKRVNPKGQKPFLGQCSPSCTPIEGGQEQALLNALEDNDKGV